MWICLNNGFLSIVQGRNNLLLVRARKRPHLEAFLRDSVFMMDILHTPERDYHWRVELDRGAVARLLTRQIRNIDYSNFKDSVKEDELHDMYALWWSDHEGYQGRSTTDTPM